MFNPTSIDEVFVQVTHLEARGKNGSLEVGGIILTHCKKEQGEKKVEMEIKEG